MVYELRRWFDNRHCLYTDDRRIKDLAIQAPDLQIVARYFRGPSAPRAFAWDIVGQPETLATIARQFRGEVPRHEGAA